MIYSQDSLLTVFKSFRQEEFRETFPLKTGMIYTFSISIFEVDLTFRRSD
uniref:Uncharacterized protein n=1 Tax=Anguilla anguilla TaxID=7936 RepID=A0A0E9XX08_ANGAN